MRETLRILGMASMGIAVLLLWMLMFHTQPSWATVGVYGFAGVGCALGVAVIDQRDATR